MHAATPLGAWGRSVMSLALGAANRLCGVARTGRDGGGTGRRRRATHGSVLAAINLL